MNNDLATRFLRGEYAGKTQRQAYQMRRLVARKCHKPHHRLRVRVQSGWAFD
ncbi:hypothetical protein ACQE3D_10735 [Methylomonas sp. MS20]|uniref:hypothetical protein n=1 Tax=unclassified Methylomonas TaxID=2608980 RepID=UPI0028A514FE|nr:hypothetical protein [Methylomonas sp. MV1]MDT4328527.1 hypothetical protein [Methylomonas sp. MV1]